MSMSSPRSWRSSVTSMLRSPCPSVEFAPCEREVARLLQQQRDVGQRLLLVVEPAFDDVRVALELGVVGHGAIERRGARRRDRIFGGALEPLAARDLRLRARQARLLLEDRVDAGAMDGGGGETHVISLPRSAANRTGWLAVAMICAAAW